MASKEEGGVLAIKTAIDGNAFILSISDEGEGVSEENRSKIFEPFFTTKDFRARSADDQEGNRRTWRHSRLYKCARQGQRDDIYPAAEKKYFIIVERIGHAGYNCHR